MSLSNPRIVAAAALLCSAACFGQANTVYGIDIGAALNMAECPRRDLAGSVMYGPSPEPCRQNIDPKPGMPLDPTGGLIAFPPGQQPFGSSWDSIGVFLVNDRVAALIVSTPGLSMQQQIYDGLVAKYGLPTEIRRAPMQTALGARLEAIVATWDKGDNLQVSFVGSAGRIDSGQLLIGTRAGLAERQERINRAVRGTTRPL